MCLFFFFYPRERVSKVVGSLSGKFASVLIVVACVLPLLSLFSVGRDEWERLRGEVLNNRASE